MPLAPLMAVREFVRPSWLLGAAVGLVGALLVYGVLQEREEQPESVGVSDVALTAPTPARPDESRPASPRDPTAQELVQGECGAEQGSCSCRRAAIEKAFAFALSSVAKEVLEGAAPDCARELAALGLRAELLARRGEGAAARQEADALLLEQPRNAHAIFATALVLFSEGSTQTSRSLAQRARELGRGAPASMLLGLLALRGDRLDEAAAHLDEAIERDPNDVEANFNRAVLLDRQGKYNLARERYLKVLTIRPGHADSRYALARLTHAAGAFDEARHHLRRLTEIAPDDERIFALSERLRGEGPSGSTLRVK